MARERRLVGPPGTGKTTAIKTMVQNWVDNREYEPRDIVLTSFTRSAAAVLAGAVDIPRENISTLHAIAYRALGQPEIAEKGKLAKQWDEQARHLSWRISEASSDIDDGLTGPDSRVGKMLRDYSLARARQVPANHPLRTSTLQFATAWEAYKHETGSMDFTDLLEYALINFDGLPRNQPVFIIDEAQDMVPLQWALAREWGGDPDCEIFTVCGDGAQVLYSFAGADPTHFMIDLPEGQHEILPRSYRMPREIQDYAERYLKGRHSGTLADGRVYEPRPGGRPGRVVNRYGVTWREPSSLIAQIAPLVEEGRSVMLLASCSYMLAPTLRELRLAGLPFHNPYRLSNGAWNPLGAVARAQVDGSTSTVDRVLAFLGGSLLLWPEMVRAEHFVMRGAKKRIEETPELDVFFEWAGLPMIEAWKARDLRWLSGSVLPQYQRPLDYAAQIIARRGKDGLLDVPLVIPSTIHAAKGGEADVVVIFPDVSGAAMQEMWSREGRDAATRLGYVALTRAREEVWLTEPLSQRASLW